MILAASLALSILLGLAAVRVAFLREGSREASSLARDIAVGAGLGLGISSVIFFLWASASDPSAVAAVVIELCAAALLLIALVRYGAPAAEPAPKTGVHESASAGAASRAVKLLIVAAFAAVVCCAAVSFVLKRDELPHGALDAWARWNLKARFIARAGERWTDMFSDHMRWSCQEYPLMLPASVSRLWMLSGESTTAPAVLGTLFALAAAATLILSVARSRGWSHGLLAGIALVGTPLFARAAASQCADVPLSLFILAATALLFEADEAQSDAPVRGRLALAGLAVGLAAWTKSEGLAFLVAVLAARLTVVAPRTGLKRLGRDMLALFVGAAAPLAALAVFKLRCSAGSLFVEGREIPLLASLLDGARWCQVAEAFFWGAALFGTLPALAFSALIAGVRVRPGEKTALASAFAALAMTAAAYFLSYLVSPFDLGWHLRTSLERLLLQLWPAALFVIFMCMRSPEEILAGVSPRSQSSPEGRRPSA